MNRPSVSTRPIGPDQLEVRTACRHGAIRAGFQLDETITERVVTCTAIFHHAVDTSCACLAGHWRRYRTATCPEDLEAMRRRFEALWSGVEAQQRLQGFAVINWPAAMRAVAGERVA